MKKLVWIGSIAVVLCIVLFIALFIVFQVAVYMPIDVEKISLSKHAVKGKNFSLDVSHISVGATSEDIIQISRVYNDGKTEVVKNIEDYNNFIGSSLIGDSLLKLIVSDTGYYGRGPDTLIVRIN